MASKIKIRIVDKESNFKLWLPAIPFWLITSLSSLALRFKPRKLGNTDDNNVPFWLTRVLSSIPMTSNTSEEINDEIKLVLGQIDEKMIKKLIKELIYEFRKHGKFDLVDISTGDGTIVKISIL